MRVDLSEIKKILLNCKNVTDAVILKNDNRLECFYSGNAKIEDIKKYMFNKIPYYAIPSVFENIDEIPITPEGKADLKALCKTPQNKVYEKLNETEKIILKYVQKHIRVNPYENLFEKGLDSLTVLDIVCELEENGLDVTFGNFYEGLSVKGIASIIANKNKNYTVWLKNEDNRKLLICFPYAGGEPQFFSKLAKKLNCDTIGVYISSFDEKQSIEYIAKKVFCTIPLKKYDDIYVYGHCVGCAPAAEFSALLNDRLKGVIFAAPAVKSKGRDSPWKIVPNNLIKKLLKKSGSLKLNDKVISNFRKDTNRYFKFKNIKIQSVNCKIAVIFGTDDIFTKNTEKIINTLEENFKGEYHQYFIKNGKHFFVETHIDETAEIISDFIK